MSRIFISHSNRDNEQAVWLRGWLRQKGFEDAFLDFDKHSGIPPGAKWERTLYSEIARAEAVLLLLTANWQQSKWCFVEFAQARALGKTIIPLIAAPLADTGLPGDIQTVDLTSKQSENLEWVARELTRIAVDARGQYDWDAKRPPFPGLLAFDKADAAIYFGRDDDVRRLVERLNARRTQGGAKLVLLLGASGSGKSSLMRAGVLPRLERDKSNWILLPAFRPQVHPLTELAQAVASAFDPPSDWRLWRDRLSSPDAARHLDDIARDLRSIHRSNEAQILLSIDQGEELFGVSNPMETSALFSLLASLLDEGRPFLVLLAMRSDYLAQLQRAVAPDVAFEDFPLRPMPLERVREIIEGPARVANLLVEDSLVSSAIRDAGVEDALPLIAFTLRESYDRHAGSGTLSLAQYQLLGDPQAGLSPLDNAVRRRADEILKEAKPAADELKALKEAFVPALVRVDADGEYARRPAELDGLGSRAQPLLEKLARARLLVIRQEGGKRLVEVAHEALLRKWPLLRGWLDEEREFLIGKERLAQDITDWQNAPPEQRDDALLSGLKLTRARAWLASRSAQLGDVERSFIARSIERAAALEKQAEDRDRNAWLHSAATRFEKAQRAAAEHDYLTAKLHLAAALVENPFNTLSPWAYPVMPADDSSGGPRLLSETRSLYYAYERRARYKLGRKIDFTRSRIGSLSFGDEGRRLAVGLPDRVEILDPVTGSSVSSVAPGRTNGTLAFSSQGRLAAAGQPDRTIHFFESLGSSGVVLNLPDSEEDVRRLVFSPDGSVLFAMTMKRVYVWHAGDLPRSTQPVALVESEDFDYSMDVAGAAERLTLAASAAGRILLWDVPPSAAESMSDGGYLAIHSVAFSRDGRHLASGGVSGTVELWDVPAKRHVGTLGRHADNVWSVAFSPHGDLVASAGWDGLVKLWTVEPMQQAGVLKLHDNLLRAVAFSPDAALLATAGDDGVVALWAQHDDPVRRLEGHGNQVTSVAFSPDQVDRLVSCSWASDEGSVLMWNLEGRESAQAVPEQPFVASAVAFAPNGDKFACVGNDPFVRIYASSGRLLHRFQEPTIIPATTYEARLGAKRRKARKIDLDEPRIPEDVSSVCFSRTGDWLAWPGGDGSLRIANLGAMDVWRTFKADETPLSSVAFSPIADLLATFDDEGVVRLWDINGDSSAIHHAGDPKGHRPRECRPIVFSPDGRYLAFSDEYNAIVFYDLAERTTSAPLSGHNEVFKKYREYVSGLAFAPRGDVLVSCGSRNSGDKDIRTIRLWHVPTRRLLYTIKVNANVKGVSFDRDGARFAAGVGRDVMIFPVMRGLWEDSPEELLRTAEGEAGRTLAEIRP